MPPQGLWPASTAALGQRHSAQCNAGRLTCRGLRLLDLLGMPL